MEGKPHRKWAVVPITEIDPGDTRFCEHCNADLSNTLPHVGLLSRCIHCRQPIAPVRMRRGPIAAKVNDRPRWDSKPALSTCTACHAPVLLTTPDPGSVRRVLEPEAVDNAGELHALMNGRASFAVYGDHPTEARTAADITDRPASVAGVVHVEHKCGEPLGIVRRFDNREVYPVAIPGEPPF